MIIGRMMALNYLTHLMAANISNGSFLFAIILFHFGNVCMRLDTTKKYIILLNLYLDFQA